jgi:hypothetical protein
MKYWRDLTDKYGFNDGGSIPYGMDKYREIYIVAINTLAKKRDCNQRVYAYDRSGAHNYYLILICNVTDIPVELEEECLCDSYMCKNLPERDNSDELNVIVDELMDEDLDRFVEIKVDIYYEEFRQFLKRIMNNG